MIEVRRVDELTCEVDAAWHLSDELPIVSGGCRPTVPPEILDRTVEGQSSFACNPFDIGYRVAATETGIICENMHDPISVSKSCPLIPTSTTRQTIH